MAVYRLQEEFQKFNRDPPANCSADLVDDDIGHWKITMNGPEGTPNEGGIFNLSIRFPIEASAGDDEKDALGDALGPYESHRRLLSRAINANNNRTTTMAHIEDHLLDSLVHNRRFVQFHTADLIMCYTDTIVSRIVQKLTSTFRGVSYPPLADLLHNFRREESVEYHKLRRRINVYFLTKIYHPNIDQNGMIYVDMLRSQWSPEFSPSYLFKWIEVLLNEPISFEEVEIDIARLYNSDREGFNKEAREWTNRYAMSDGKKVLHRLERDLSDFNRDPPANCPTNVVEGDLFNWKVTIEGPESTPYAGGSFKLSIRFPTDYPYKPPQIFFPTKIYHPNIDHNGQVYVDPLREKWRPSVKVAVLLLSIDGLLKAPISFKAIEFDIAMKYKNDREGFNKEAREWTEIYAMPGGSMALRRLKKDLSDFNRDPPANCTAAPVEGDLYNWTATIKGPEGTPYEGGVFKLSIRYPHDFPNKPPLIFFLTKIYHPNIQQNGRVHVDILGSQWSPEFNISYLLMSILLNEPNPDETLSQEKARLYKNDREGYNQVGRDWTKRYAMPGGSKMALPRLQNDLSEFNRDRPANCSNAVVDGNIHKWKISIKGPEGTPYEGGVFNLSIRFTFEYPSKPPAIVFLTQIYHTNVQRSTNYLSMDLLRRKWALGSGPNDIADLLKWVVGLLKDPIPDEAFEYHMAKKYLLDREGYNKQAREWTQRYAM